MPAGDRLLPHDDMPVDMSVVPLRMMTIVVMALDMLALDLMAAMRGAVPALRLRRRRGDQGGCDEGEYEAFHAWSPSC